MPHANDFSSCVLNAVMPLHAGPPQGAGPRGMLQQLLEAEDDTAHHETVLSLVQANGFDAMCYGRLQPVQGGTWSWCADTRYGVDDAFDDLVFAPVHDVERDPRLAPALRSCLPVFWSADDFQLGVPLGRFASGATLALAGPAAGERSVVLLLSQRAHSGRDIDDASFGRVLVLGLGVHDRHTRHRAEPVAADRRPAAASGLSARQRDVLRCLAVGLADKQIADRLDMSLHTVDYHMRQLRKRFGARNRLQLTQLWESEM
jgi:DNA-binding CsgD family transcriptional regulator